MSSLRRPGFPPSHHASIHDIPNPVLAYIFSFLERRNFLSVLSVSKAWLAVAGEHCGAIWDGLCVDGDRVRLEGALDERLFQSGFMKRAGNMSTLHLRCYKEASTLLLPGLLQTLVECSGSRLQVLDMEVQFLERTHYTACCKAVGQLTALHHLRLNVAERVNDQGRIVETPPLAPLLQLSSLSRLEGLAVKMLHWTSDKHVISTLLPCLTGLTQLAWNTTGVEPDRVKVCWQRPDGSGPSVRDLSLRGCTLGMPEGAAEGTGLLLRSLQHVERLKLRDARPVAAEQLADVLPQLPALTSFALARFPAPRGVEEQVLQAALLCPHLLELKLFTRGSYSVPLPHAPPGSLQQLTKLAVEGFCNMPPAWSLPQLKHLYVGFVESEGFQGDFSATRLRHLALNPSVEELVLDGPISISGATWAISELGHLTRLSMSTCYGESIKLYDGPYLAGVKELVLRQCCASYYHVLPPALAQATSLEQLDLTEDRWLALQEQDVHLLTGLPSLKAVRLPMPGREDLRFVPEARVKSNAMMAEYVQEKLSQAGVTVVLG